MVLLQAKKLGIEFYCEKKKSMLYFSKKEGEIV